MNRKFSAAMLLGAATLALGSCCTSRVSNDIKKDTAIHGVEADMIILVKKRKFYGKNTVQ